MSLLSGSYDVAVRAFRRASPLFASGSSKLSVGVRERRGAAETLEEWARNRRDPARPLVWMHAPSVGESLQARVVLEALQDLRPDVQSVYTFFSPSAASRAEGMPSDVSGYLPWDVRSELFELLAVVDPTLIVFTKTEVWPGLTAAARERGIPVVLCAATLAADAGRLRPWARPLLRPTFGALSRVLAISDEDGRRFEQLGVPSGRITVCGDPGVDSAWARAGGGDRHARHMVPFLGVGPVLVAGSTWEADERVLVPVIGSLSRTLPDLISIVAPHEPTEEHLGALETRLGEIGIESARLGVVEERGRVGSARVVVVDRVGVLMDLYGVGDVVYVGGGFHGQGLHSVIEPAAAGLPVTFGPQHASSLAAMELMRIGGARHASSEPELARILGSWLSDDTLRREIGERAQGYVERHRGAAERTARALVECLASSEGVLSDGGGA